MKAIGIKTLNKIVDLTEFKVKQFTGEKIKPFTSYGIHFLIFLFVVVSFWN
jgi:hypothetical protein